MEPSIPFNGRTKKDAARRRLGQRMRSHALAAVLVALLAATAALAGCLGTAAATAMQTRDEADAAAKRWDKGAMLAQVVGVEGSSSLAGLAAAYGASGDHSRGADDEEIGDGRCEVWVYRYVASAKPKAFVVVVDREGNVLRAGEETRTREDATPLGAWSIDSDRALEIAKDASAGLRDGAGKDHFALASVLRHAPGARHATWTIAGGGGDMSGGGGGVVEIDAVDGRVLSAHGGSGSWSGWSWR